jgi:hypothetical protein
MMTKNENMSANIMLTLSARATITATREETRFYAHEHGGSDRTVLVPTVRFETQDGRTMETVISPIWYWEAPKYRLWGGPDISSLIEVGDEVVVVYDPQDPESAQIEPVERKRRETREMQRSCLRVMLIFFAIGIFVFIAIPGLIFLILTLAALFG